MDSIKSSGEARRAAPLRRPLRRPIYRLFRVTVAAGFLRAARRINRSSLGKHGRIGRTSTGRRESRLISRRRSISARLGVATSRKKRPIRLARNMNEIGRRSSRPTPRRRISSLPSPRRPWRVKSAIAVVKLGALRSPIFCRHQLEHQPVILRDSVCVSRAHTYTLRS
jgi:plasmid stabilization system protein ParE